jgi:2-oxoglutarate decarboxylase
MTVAMPSTPATTSTCYGATALDGIHRPLIVFTPVDAAQQGRGERHPRLHRGKFRSILQEPTTRRASATVEGEGILLTSGRIYDLIARKAR